MAPLARLHLARQRLQHEALLVALFRQERHHRTGPNAQAGQRGPPRLYLTAQKHLVWQTFAEHFHDHMIAGCERCRGGHKQSAVRQV